MLDAAKHRAVATLPNKIQQILSRYARTQIGGIEAKVRYGIIDWEHTHAYFDENPYYPVLRINLRGRQPHGIVEPGREYENLRADLIDRLDDWRHPDTGERIVERAYRREEVYSGPCLDEAPDIVVKWNTHEDYTYAFRLSSKSSRLAWTEEIDPSQPENMAFFTGKSGSHRDNGIFVAEGPAVRAGTELRGAKIIDVAPTILHLMGVAVPRDMDGRVLVDMLDTDSVSTDVPIGVAASAVPYDVMDSTYTEEDTAVIAERLRALGYIE
jgi:predicted AlkP superfamily phosphohydrolase/phosphomutase